MPNTTFDDRRKSDPQGVIDDLVKQTTRQAKKINELSGGGKAKESTKPHWQYEGFQLYNKKYCLYVQMLDEPRLIGVSSILDATMFPNKEAAENVHKKLKDVIIVNPIDELGDKETQKIQKDMLASKNWKVKPVLITVNHG